MQLHHISPKHKGKTRKRIGRGGKRGTYSGRGVKGQRARAGARVRPALRDLIKKIPKRRGEGYFRPFSLSPAVLNVQDLEIHFANGDRVTPAILVEKRILRHTKGRLPTVKLLGSGTLTKKLVVSECRASGEARRKIEKAGGSIT